MPLSSIQKIEEIVEQNHKTRRIHYGIRLSIIDPTNPLELQYIPLLLKSFHNDRNHITECVAFISEWLQRYYDTQNTRIRQNRRGNLRYRGNVSINDEDIHDGMVVDMETPSEKYVWYTNSCNNYNIYIYYLQRDERFNKSTSLLYMYG